MDSNGVKKFSVKNGILTVELNNCKIWNIFNLEKSDMDKVLEVLNNKDPIIIIKEYSFVIFNYQQPMVTCIYSDIQEVKNG